MIFWMDCLIAYFLGSIPTGYWIGRFRYGVDIRTKGSGNVGATNVFRVLGKTPGSLTLAIDILKGVVATLWGAHGFSNHPWGALICGVVSILGHTTSPWVGFKGGKGVATACGVFAVLLPLPTLISTGVFILVFWLTRIVSVGSLVSALTLFIASCFIPNTPLTYQIAAGTIALFVFWTHRTNIQRLLKGEEHGFQRKTS